MPTVYFSTKSHGVPSLLINTAKVSDILKVSSERGEFKALLKIFKKNGNAFSPHV